MKNKTPNFPLLLSEEGRAAIKEVAIEMDRTEADVIREALQIYFQARGKSGINFSPGTHGGKRTK